MAASFNESQKIDYLWKKVGYGVTKTAEPASKEAFNESIASPLLYRGDLIWTQSGDIPASPPASTTSLVQVYKDGGGAGYSPTVQCTEDLTAPDNQTWKTNLINWIPTQFGDNYLVQVYAGAPGLSNPQTAGTKLFGAGSGSDDTWFFDYQSGVLNFNGATIPTAIGTGTANTIYVVGYRYVGEYGVDTTFISNGTSNVNIATANGNITMGVNGTGNVAVISNTGAHISGVVSASGNVTGNYFIGNGSQLTGVAASSVNANALVGNTLSSNVLYSSLTQVGTLSNVSITGNVVGGNLTTAGQVTATGNITGGNVLTGGVVSATSNITGGNILFGTGVVSGTGNIQGGNLLTAGVVSATSTITGGNLETGGTLSATANITGGNVLTGGVVSATGNVTGGGLITTGPSGNISGANVISATTFTASGNVTGGNILTVGLVSATGNVFGNSIRSDNYCYANGVPIPTGIVYTAATSPPAGPDVADQWYDTTNDVLYEYINDGTSNYWVDTTSPAFAGGVVANVAISGTLVPVANVTYDVGTSTVYFRNTYTQNLYTNNRLPAYNMPVGAVVQTVMSSSLGGSITNSGSYVDVTYANVTITPTSANSRVLILATGTSDFSAVVGYGISADTQLVRSPSTSLQIQTVATSGTGGVGATGAISYSYVDTPATTSAVTYKLQQRVSNASSTLTSTNIWLIAMEIAAS
jgi:hypothetical protein